ncbi:MAG: DedA family protein [Gammaproteobacteria bacterium]|nr:DedA family protein [Gammaproteobacteria bacterium]
MKLFGPLYDKMLAWSSHRLAARYLAAVSFAEASFFPLPTALLLAPMALAKRERAWHFAALATVTSVLGGVFGYFIGAFLFEPLGRPIVEFYAAQAQFDAVQTWFGDYGAWLVLLAGVTPIPYKLVTLASGLLGLPLLWFVAASVAGRAAQFYLIAGLLWWGGAAVDRQLRRWAEPAGWGAVALAAAAYWAWR